LPGFENYASIEKEYFETIEVNNVSNPKNYFINCDLIDKQQSLLNGKPSSLLAFFDIRGKPYEKVYYQNTHFNVLRDVSAEENVSSLTLSIRDENGKPFDFNGTNLTYELELN